MSADPRHGDRRSFFRHNRLHLFPLRTCLVDAYADESIDAVTTP